MICLREEGRRSRSLPDGTVERRRLNDYVDDMEESPFGSRCVLIVGCLEMIRETEPALRLASGD